MTQFGFDGVAIVTSMEHLPADTHFAAVMEDIMLTPLYEETVRFITYVAFNGPAARDRWVAAHAGGRKPFRIIQVSPL